ncbi:MAG: alpha/beta fold hydrolase [Acidobacteriota bacterium]|nr:alpha/beta fold hydrolase [Acidobacteriota bacterium]MDE2963909.1 alpha/beta fold hydrolase [Acidobacteriota bacterium]
MKTDIATVDRVEANGVRLAYTQCGEGADVVFLHGWMCNRAFWQRQCRELAGRNFRCTAVDFRGHGDSEAPDGGYTIQQLAGDVSAMMAALGIEPAVIVGHSMGGMVAQHFCLERPDQTAALVLVATIAFDREDRLISKRIAAGATRMGFARAFDRHFDAWFAPGAPQSVRGWVKRRMRSTPDEVGLKLVGAYGRFDLTSRLGGIQRPTLVVGTRSDDSAPPAQSRRLAELIPGARLALIEDCGHFPMLEKPESMTRTLLPFLEARAGSGED